jgi:hypothetical protein
LDVWERLLLQLECARGRTATPIAAVRPGEDRRESCESRRLRTEDVPPPPPRGGWWPDSSVSASSVRAGDAGADRSRASSSLAGFPPVVDVDSAPDVIAGAAAVLVSPGSGRGAGGATR